MSRNVFFLLYECKDYCLQIAIDKIKMIRKIKQYYSLWYDTNNISKQMIRRQ